MTGRAEGSRRAPEAVRHRLARFAERAAGHGLDLPASPPFPHAMEAVWDASEFVAGACERDPDLLADLLRTGDLLNPAAPGDIHRRVRRAAEAGDEAALAAALRRVRRREMVRIAWRDIAGWADLEETTGELTALAEAALEAAYSRLSAWERARSGSPTGPGGAPMDLVILGMGKLGAGELNFSSDIDLVFAYPEEGEVTGGPAPLTHHEFFERLARRLIKAIGAVTADGFVFRVDTRLRPYGESGPLVMGFDAMETYYEGVGREWERYAWIKARPVAGDLDAGTRLLDRLRPFVYRRYLDFGVFESLREMKALIRAEIRRKGLEDDIKLGPGGIREVEFIGQVFQLVHGGRIPELRRRRLLEVLPVLAGHGFLPAEVADRLAAGYRFLRRVEHRLQEYADRQTHRLPTDPEDRRRLARAMGYPGWTAFAADLSRVREEIDAAFRGLLEPGPRAPAGDAAGRDMADVWQAGAASGRARSVLAEAGYTDPDRLLAALDGLRKAPSLRLLSPEGRRRLDRLVPRLLERAARTKRPLQAALRTLAVVEAIGRRTAYFALLAENPGALDHLVRLCEASPWVADHLARHPAVLDELLDPAALMTPPDRGALEAELRARLGRLDPDDLEGRMDELRRFKQANLLRVAAADLAGTQPLVETSRRLTELAEVILAEVVRMAWDHLEAKHGRPPCDSAEGEPPCFAVAAYGKFGGVEMGYGSDLDLVFLHDGRPGAATGGPRPVDVPVFFARLGQRVIHILATHTPAGRLYPVDMRLRPSGEAGLLVSHVDAFAAYQREQAWTWEHQALVRARVVAGPEALARRFVEIRAQVLARPRDPVRLAREIRGMRDRLVAAHAPEGGEGFDPKFDPGGILDIEFLVQYLVLLEAHRHPKILEWTSTIRFIDALAGAGILPGDEARRLRQAYLEYREAVHRCHLEARPARVPAERFGRLREGVRRAWRRHLPPG
ncbi:bifunctional [glutamate--ammonia ligase]-adenylyl-L-tyrosine phosphorylase/[glutamate--ammonia-ligase] adenylyltransferase [Dissulfurirhabdus thermomarina]|uniref:Bifunctional [glutamate--ammonia ligase]-adenylyl-L-tyrosine phosphorylase/[glutamate--ammonia-ligase] adenylyltransferase n=1 Tax=Dissulfurirhabdus thermomarina TaxID=1765737 RepID=A0A6N9TK49_DISTH|nr:bifunctional [glutamate--ammonia ligase]-adenylyl-L-tyrosine phosphorylase/[glutamate--ammonia-ligase] adenylyltransferase [Dissulfurirhabdus thermomarina]NDY41625.1 bifunctional [glutamate--ammonia ligase]-adenylyl-L-tyrosine phosphorylase/[glutamate--ammonia-ligase] adenylyltransferase [Dissulfurirhabdus thermomarina]NMX23332.1 bifunctional [glutamate--ammonia ligase]-adenylyl-L-tyrosine phosphorylase/[glutamate--ammonia-ligase] adenylyltransferase [Dissulfurirhabdus thermomarina]